MEKAFCAASGLTQFKLFSGISEECLEPLLACIGARRRLYTKGEIVIEAGSRVDDVGILLSGHGRAVKWDESGKVVTISLLERGSLCGVLLAAEEERGSPVTVEALTDMGMLQIPFSRVLGRCEKRCEAHERLLRNLIHAVAEKGLELHERLNCLLQPTARAKILAYLTNMCKAEKNHRVSIPFDRNAMAEYLNMDRSALSRELSRMKRDGLIEYRLNRFELL